MKIAPFSYMGRFVVDLFNANLGTGFTTGVVMAIATLSDGKILVGGSSDTFNGNSISRIICLNTDGTPNTAFNTNLGTGFNGTVFNIVEQADGKILVSGGFTTFNGNSRNRLARLNADGTEDTTFATNLGSGFSGGANGNVVALQSDGKIITGGSFTTFNGNTRNRLVRLNADGTEDTTFYTNLGTGVANTINVVAVYPDDKVVIGGIFTTINGVTRNRLARLNTNGSVDTAFYTNMGTAFAAGVSAIKVQSDSKIVVGGSFTSFNALTRNRVLRLNSDGTEDSTFYTNIGSAANNEVRSIFVQSDGKIILGGTFATFNGVTRNRVVRLVSTGVEDTPFYTNTGTAFNGSVLAITLASDSKLLFGGQITLFNGVSYGNFLKVNPNGTAAN